MNIVNGDTFLEDILIVDDAPENLNLLESLLNDAGYRVRSASDGKLALRSSQARPPALILLDIKMPGLDGYEVCRRLKADERSRSIPVIFISVLEDEREKVKGFQAGGVDYINKPFYAEEVLARVKMHLALRRAQVNLEQRNAELAAARDTLEEKVRERTAELAQANDSLTAEVAERKRAEEQIGRLNQRLERRARELAALNQAGRIMTSTLELDKLLELMLGQVERLLDAEAASALLCEPPMEAVDASQACLVFAAATGPAADRLVGLRLPADVGIAGRVAREKRSARVGDAQSDPRFYHNVDATTGLVTRSLLAVPLLFKDRVLGVVEAINKDGGAFDENDLEMLEALCTSAAIAIENARLYATEQQRAEALGHALERQRELDRLQREFMQNVSHELRTPLALVRGHAEMLDNGWLGELQPKQKESISVVARRAIMLSNLVNDIVSVLEVEQRALVRESVDLESLVRACLEEFQDALDRSSLILNLEIAPDLPLVSGDLLALRRVVDNLVGNALKFTPSGGCVTVRLSGSQETVSLEVTDTGIGISAEHLARIFERFYQVNGSATRKYGGMGLGLALVREIIEAHGGQVAVTSEVGRGSSFNLTLPRLVPSTSD